MPIPAAIETHQLLAGAPAPCANAGVASNKPANDMNKYCSFFIVLLLLPKYAASGWLMLTVLAPSRCTALEPTGKWEPSPAKLKVYKPRSNDRARPPPKDRSRPAGRTHTPAPPPRPSAVPGRP